MTDTLLAGIAGRAARGTLAGAGEIGTAAGKVIDKYKMGKHVHTTITFPSFTYRPDQAALSAEAALDGIYAPRTSVDTDTRVFCGGAKLHSSGRFYLRPIHLTASTDRVKAHVVICLLAW